MIDHTARFLPRAEYLGNPQYDDRALQRVKEDACAKNDIFDLRKHASFNGNLGNTHVKIAKLTSHI